MNVKYRTDQNNSVDRVLRPLCVEARSEDRDDIIPADRRRRRRRRRQRQLARR